MQAMRSGNFAVPAEPACFSIRVSRWRRDSASAPALAAAAVDTVQRIHRLLDPAQPLDRARRQLLRATAAAFALTPVLLALAPAMLALALGRVPGAAALATLARRAPEYSHPG